MESLRKENVEGWRKSPETSVPALIMSSGAEQILVSAPETMASEIANHPFLRGLSLKFLTRVAQRATTRTFVAGEFLLREGEAADRLYLVCSGKVALEVKPPDRRPLTIETVGAGTIVGWSWSVAPCRYELDARALRTVRTVAIEAEALRSACEEDTADGYRFLERLLTVVADRLSSTRLQLVDAEQR